MDKQPEKTTPTRPTFDAGTCTVQVTGYSTKRGKKASGGRHEFNRYAWSIQYNGDSLVLGVRRAKTRRDAFLDAIHAVGLLRAHADIGMVGVPDDTVGPKQSGEDAELWSEWQGIVNPDHSAALKRGRTTNKLEDERNELAVALDAYDPTAVRNIIEGDDKVRAVLDEAKRNGNAATITKLYETTKTDEEVLASAEKDEKHIKTVLVAVVISAILGFLFGSALG